MKKIYTLILSALLVGCSDELDKIGSTTEGAVELTGINATIETSTAGTRAANDPVYLPEHISRFRFENGDRMTFTTIKRTDHALADFNYVGVEFQSNASGAWDRDKNTGYLDGKSTSEHPQRVYWSDALSRHTFIGFSLPKVDGFDWVKDGNNYVGSIGDKTKTKETEPSIDYNPETAETDIIKEKKDDGSTIDKEIKKSSKMRAEDLLLSYATDLVADASVANVKFYHALSSIKVQVSMSAFYGSALDGYTIVKDMKLLNQPTLYKWTVSSAKAEPFDATSHINNNPKDMMLWDYYPQGNGNGANKTFTFYGITVPQEAGKYELQDMVLTFKVKYPDPQKTKPEDIKEAIAAGQEWPHWIEKPFKATISKDNPVYFHPGQCTIINLRLNHMDEELTVGAEYMDWQFTPQPDEGDLHKNTTFLESKERSTVNTTKNNVTEDDATWLYYVSQNGQTTDELSDIYGHKGKSPQDAFTISTADQLLAFAYEVNEGINFEGYYVKLDADIYMQPSTTANSVEWIGIGNDTITFNGYFIGGDRKISRLIGEPLFIRIGSSATIDNLVLADTIRVSGPGALANTNAGTIIGCVVDADVISSAEGAGSLVGTNTSTGKIETCYHIGSMTGTGAVSGLVGTNKGTMTGCYNAGTIISKSDGTCYGVTNSSTSGTETGCYYNKTLAGTLGGGGKTTVEMQKLDFTNTINSSLANGKKKYSYKFYATQYPSLELYNVTTPTLLPDGFYRVKNVGSERYVYVTDDDGYCNSTSQDLDAIVLRKGLNNAISDAGSIVYVKYTGSSNEYDLISQGASIKTIASHYAVVVPTSDHYRVGASERFNKYLVDANETADDYGKVDTHVSEDKNYLLWDPTPVDDSSDNYFGLSAESALSLTKESKTTYYVPFYAGFGFDPASRGMEVFYISQMNESEGKVCLKKITGTVPANTPVIVACSAADASGNRLSLKYSNATFAPKNYLKGNMFNFTNEDIPGKLITHTNRTTYKPETMRVLEVRDGELAFVKKTDLSYLPANSSYLVVSAGAPDVITVETVETYNEPSGTTNNPIKPGYYHVQNFGSKRYLSVVDDKVSINVQEVNITHDLNALALNKTLNTCDPGSIVYVTADGDVTSQGVSLKSKIPGFTINERKDAENKTHYRVGAERSGLSRYICDAITTNTEESGKVDTHVGDDKNYLLWDAIKVNEFTLSSTITTSSTYYAPFYAEFGFEIPSGMEVYYVEKVNLSISDNPQVVLKKLSGTIPNNTPVIIAYSSSANKLVPKFENTSLSVANLLKGNMFNTSITGHVNRTQVTANMRVLSVGTDGNLVFTTPATGSYYLPANQSYLEVGEGTPGTISVVFDN